MLVCHKTCSIFFFLYPLFFFKQGRLISSKKFVFTHGSIRMPFLSVCYLVSCADISLYRHTVLITGKVLTGNPQLISLSFFSFHTPFFFSKAFYFEPVSAHDPGLSSLSACNLLNNYTPFPCLLTSLMH